MIHALPSPVAQKRWRGGGVRGMILKYEAPQPFGRGAKGGDGMAIPRNPRSVRATCRTFICSRDFQINLVSMPSGPRFCGTLRVMVGC